MLSEFQYRLIQVLVLVHIWSQQLLTETEYRIQVHQLQSRRSVHTQALEVLWLTMEQRTCFTLVINLLQWQKDNNMYQLQWCLTSVFLIMMISQTK